MDDILQALYNKHRTCLIKKGQEVSVYQDAVRMTLGYEKADLLVRTSEVLPGMHVMNVFSGAAGLIRLLSCTPLASLIGVDLLNEGPEPSPYGWYYAADEAFAAWEHDLEQVNIHPTQPVYIQNDVFKPMPVFHRSMDRIILDPPFGVVSHETLNLTKSESVKLFCQALLVSVDYIAPNGKIISIVPRPWLEPAKQVSERLLVEKEMNLYGNLDLSIIVMTVKE